MKRLRASLWLRLVVMVLAVSALAAATAEAQWRRLDSPNFVVMGDVSARDLRDIAVQFEGFRETLARVLGARVTTTAVPTVVIVFPHDRAFTPFKPKFNGKPVDVAGLFVPGRDINYILLRNDVGPDGLRIVLHEYTHLVASNSDRPLPIWLGEGIAEFYSTFQLERGGREAVLGGVIVEHLAQLNETVLIPLNDLLKIEHDSPLYNEGSRRGVLYAQSWALTHLIVMGQPSRTTQLAAYLQNLSLGQSPADAWKQAFGAENMQGLLETYIRRQAFYNAKFKFSEGVAKFDAAATAAPMPPADVQAYQADLLVRLDDLDGASARLAQAQKVDAANARAVVAGARLALARQQTDGHAAALRALPTPTDWLLSYLAGTSLVQLVGPRQTDDLDHVRRFFKAAQDGRGDIPHAVSQLAAMELASDAGPAAGTAAALTRLREQAPGRYEYAFLYAQMLARKSEFAQAREVVGPFMTVPYPAAIQKSARSLMGFLVDVENGRASSRSTASIDGPPTETRDSNAPPKTTLIFRQTKAGEQRTEGVLDRIECVQGRGIVFNVKAGDTVVSASAPTFSDVEFITYRDDLGGSVTCGPLKTPVTVYLTWRLAADGTSRIAVAVEILPKAPSARELADLVGFEGVGPATPSMGQRTPAALRDSSRVSEPS